VAHGKKAPPSDLRGKDGEVLQLEEFAAVKEALVREAMKGAIKRVAAGEKWPPDWDAVILRSP